MAVSAEPPPSGLSGGRSFADDGYVSDKRRAKPHARRRKKGDEPLRAAILRAAAEVFALRGLAGASMDEVGEASGCGKRMLYYYFASKEALHREVVIAAYVAMNARWLALRLEAFPANEALALFIGNTFDFCLDHQGVVRLVTDHALHARQNPADAAAIAALNAPTVAALAGVVVRGAADGVFRDEIDILDLHLSISALCMFKGGEHPGRRESVIRTVLNSVAR